MLPLLRQFPCNLRTLEWAPTLLVQEDFLGMDNLWTKEGTTLTDLQLGMDNLWTKEGSWLQEISNWVWTICQPRKGPFQEISNWDMDNLWTKEGTTTTMLRTGADVDQMDLAAIHDSRVKFDHLQEHSGLEPIIVYNGQNTGVASEEVQTLGETSTHMPHSLESAQKTNAELYNSVVGHCKIRARWVDKIPLVQGNCRRICNLADLSHYILQGEGATYHIKQEGIDLLFINCHGCSYSSTSWSSCSRRDEDICVQVLCRRKLLWTQWLRKKSDNLTTDSSLILSSSGNLP